MLELSLWDAVWLQWTPEGRRLVTGASSGEFTLWNGLTFNFETILQVSLAVWSVCVCVWRLQVDYILGKGEGSVNLNWFVSCVLSFTFSYKSSSHCRCSVCVRERERRRKREDRIITLGTDVGPNLKCVLIATFNISYKSDGHSCRVAW